MKLDKMHGLPDSTAKPACQSVYAVMSHITTQQIHIRFLVIPHGALSGQPILQVCNSYQHSNIAFVQ